MTIRCELIDELIKEYPHPQDILAEDGLLKQLTKAVIERCLETELDMHLGYPKHARQGNETGNRRHGQSQKTLKGEQGYVETEVSSVHTTERAKLRYLSKCKEKGKGDIMIEMVLQYTLYGLGIVITVSATILGILSWHTLSGALRKIREAQADGQPVSWYTSSPALTSIGLFQLSPALFLFAITFCFLSAESTWLILRLVLAIIALALVGIGLFFIIRGRRLSQATSMESKRQR
jgi:hypothetical protein